MAEEVCSVRGCGGEVKARGWCGLHYGRWYRWGDPLRGDPRRTSRATPKPRRKGTGRRGRPRLDWRSWLDLDRLTRVTPRAGWERNGNCYKQGDTGRFFRTRGELHSQARQQCAGCPAVYACLADALSRHEYADKGWWGNTSERQRRTIRRALRQHRTETREPAA